MGLVQYQIFFVILYFNPLAYNQSLKCFVSILDDEDLPDFNLTPEKIAAQRKKLAEKKALMEMEKQKKKQLMKLLNFYSWQLYLFQLYNKNRRHKLTNKGKMIRNIGNVLKWHQFYLIVYKYQ